MVCAPLGVESGWFLGRRAVAWFLVSRGSRGGRLERRSFLGRWPREARQPAWCQAGSWFGGRPPRGNTAPNACQQGCRECGEREPPLPLGSRTRRPSAPMWNRKATARRAAIPLRTPSSAPAVRPRERGLGYRELSCRREGGNPAEAAREVARIGRRGLARPAEHRSVREVEIRSTTCSARLTKQMPAASAPTTSAK